MKKVMGVLLGILMAFVLSIDGYAGVYMSVEGGYSWLDTSGDIAIDGEYMQKPVMLTSEFDDGAAYVGAKLGYAFTDRFRMDVSYAKYDDTDVKNPLAENAWFDGEFGMQSVMLSAYWDFLRSGDFSMYIGVGAGAAELTYDMKSVNSIVRDELYTSPMDWGAEDWQFAWKAELGMGYDFTDHLGMYAGVRYADYGDIDENLLEQEFFAISYSQEAKGIEAFGGLTLKF